MQFIMYLTFTKLNHMKKLFILFAAVTLFVGVQSCKQKAADEAPTEESTEVEAVTSDPTPAAATDSDTTRIPVPPTDPIKK